LKRGTSEEFFHALPPEDPHHVPEPGADVEIREGWYLPIDTRRKKVCPRWVLKADESNVYYSKGGARHFFCARTTFGQWVKRNRASLSKREPPPQIEVFT